MSIEKVKLNIEGMSCGHCEKAVSNILLEIPGVNVISVKASAGLAEIAYNKSVISLEEIKNQINNSGIYKAN